MQELQVNTSIPAGKPPPSVLAGSSIAGTKGIPRKQQAQYILLVCRELRGLFKAACSAHGRTMKEVMVHFMLAYIHEGEAVEALIKTRERAIRQAERVRMRVEKKDGP